MNSFFQSRTFKALAVVFCMLFAFMLRGIYTGEILPFTTKLLGAAFIPIASVSSSVGGFFEGIVGPLLSAYNTAAENVKLKDEVYALKEKLVDYEIVKNENAQYRQFLEIKERSSDLVFEPATVIGRSQDSPFSAFVINVGSFHGIEPRSAVITPHGLVGIVSGVGYNYSEVTTILDPTLEIGCIASRTLDTGVVSGDTVLSLRGISRMSFVAKDSGLSVGDYIVTSGVGGLFPKNIIVGTVGKIATESSGLSLYAEIQPSVDPAQVKNVFVIKDFSGRATAK